MRSATEKRALRMRRERPFTTIHVGIPEDLVVDLTDMAVATGYEGYEDLVRSYIGHGLRQDEMKLAQPEVTIMLDSLRRHGISDEVIAEVMSETMRKSA